MEMVDLADLQHLSQRLQHSVSGATINSQRLNNVPVTSFLFFLEVQSLFPLQGDFL